VQVPAPPVAAFARRPQDAGPSRPAAAPFSATRPVQSRSKAGLLLGCGLALFAGGMFAGGLLLFAVMSWGGWLKDRGAPEKAPVADRGDAGRPTDKPADKPADGPADKPADSPADKSPDKPGGKPPDKPAGPAEPAAEVVVADLRKLYGDYNGNEAAADAKYLNKRIEFVFLPKGIDKEASGTYCAWDNLLHLSAAEIYGRHYQCHFRADQTAALAGFKEGQFLLIRGVCVGKTGMIRTSNGFVGQYGGTSADPVVEFKECELVRGKPTGSTEHKLRIRADKTLQDTGLDVPQGAFLGLLSGPNITARFRSEDGKDSESRLSMDALSPVAGGRLFVRNESGLETEVVLFVLTEK
jgi:hypothetical protein